MDYKWLAALLGASFLQTSHAANNDMQGFLQCIKPKAIYVEGVADNQLTTQCQLPVQKEDYPELVFFSKGWKNQTGIDNVCVDESVAISLSRELQLTNGKTNLFTHSDASSLTSIRSNRGLVCEYNQSGDVYLKGSDDANAFAVDKDCFDGSPDFDELAGYESSVKFVCDYSEDHPDLFSMMKRFHNVNLIDDSYSSTTIIPKITHTILGATVNSESLNHLKHNLKVLKPDFGWHHIIWVNDNSFLGSIDDDIKQKCEVKSIKDEVARGTDILKRSVAVLKDKNEYVMTSYLGYYLTNAYGGWHVDKDVELVQSLDRFSKPTFVTFIDHTFMPLLTTALFGVTRNNAITNQCLLHFDQILEKMPKLEMGYGEKHDAYCVYGNGTLTRSFLDKKDQEQILVMLPMSFLDCPSFALLKTVEDPQMVQDTHLMAVHFTDKK